MQMIFRFWENLKRLYYIVEKRKKKKWCLGVLLCLQQLLCGLYNDDSTSLPATPILPTAIPDSIPLSIPTHFDPRFPIPSSIPTHSDSRFHVGFQLTPTPDSRCQVRYLESMTGPLFDLVSKPGFEPGSGFKELWDIFYHDSRKQAEAKNATKEERQPQPTGAQEEF